MSTGASYSDPALAVTSEHLVPEDTSRTLPVHVFQKRGASSDASAPNPHLNSDGVADYLSVVP